MKKKLTAIALVVALLAVAIVGGTLAFFTDTTDQYDNTFTVGKVDIELTETSEAADGTVGTAKEGKGYDYENIVPGTTYAKRATVSVAAGSQDAYVFAELIVKNNDKLEAVLAEAVKLGEIESVDLSKLDEIFLDNADLGSLVGYWKTEGKEELHLVYLLDEAVAAESSQTLFTGVIIPEGLDKSLAVLGDESVDLDVIAYAIQRENVETAADAFAELFPTQDYKG